MSRLLIYGANGYTGRLIAREAARRGLKPLLAGRNRDEAGQDDPQNCFHMGLMLSTLRENNQTAMVSGPMLTIVNASHRLSRRRCKSPAVPDLRRDNRQAHN